jgi:very-short-patch-repair endonuclease
MKAQITIETILNAHGLKYEKEHKFHDKRKFRFDYAIPDIKLAIEYEGGTWSGGAHTRGKHYSSDCEKYNLAQINGWIVLRYTTDTVKSVEQIYNDILEVKLYRRVENENR